MNSTARILSSFELIVQDSMNDIANCLAYIPDLANLRVSKCMDQLIENTPQGRDARMMHNMAYSLQSFKFSRWMVKHSLLSSYCIVNFTVGGIAAYTAKIFNVKVGATLGALAIMMGVCTGWMSLLSVAVRAINKEPDFLLFAPILGSFVATGAVLGMPSGIYISNLLNKFLFKDEWKNTGRDMLAAAGLGSGVWAGMFLGIKFIEKKDKYFDLFFSQDDDIQKTVKIKELKNSLSTSKVCI